MFLPFTLTCACKGLSSVGKSLSSKYVPFGVIKTSPHEASSSALEATPPQNSKSLIKISAGISSDSLGKSSTNK